MKKGSYKKQAIRHETGVKQAACGSEHKFNNELHEMHPCIIYLAEIDGETKFVKASEWENGSKYFREDFAKWKFNSKPSVPVENRAMPEIADIIQKAAKDWDVKVIGGKGVPRTGQDELIEKCANMQIQQFALYVEQKIFESNFTA